MAKFRPGSLAGKGGIAVGRELGDKDTDIVVIWTWVWRTGYGI